VSRNSTGQTQTSSVIVALKSLLCLQCSCFIKNPDWFDLLLPAYPRCPDKRPLLLLLHPFNDLFSRTSWVSRYHKGKSFWILLEQEIMGWQWHQLDHMQIICTLLQTDNHASTLPLNFYRLDALPAAQPTASKHCR